MIRKESYIPPKKASRSEIVAALGELKEGESLMISGESLTDRTQAQVYKAASRLGLAIRTNKTSIGLRVWLKSSERASIERQSEVKEGDLAESSGIPVNRPDYFPPESGPDRRTKEQKQRYLAEYFAGEARQTMQEIDKEAYRASNEREEERKVIPFEDL